MALYLTEILWLGIGIVSSSLPTATLGAAVTSPGSGHFQAPTLTNVTTTNVTTTNRTTTNVTTTNRTTTNVTTEEDAIVESIKKYQHSETSGDETERLTLPNHVDSSAGSVHGTVSNTSLLLHLNSKGLDQLTASWTMDPNATEEVTCFVATYRTGKGEHYDSNPLGKLVREYTFTSLDKDEEYTICIHAMINSTSVQEVCSVWSESSMKIIVGVLAGVVGLIPCFVALLWVMRKDKKMVAYEVLESNEIESGGKDAQIPVKDNIHGCLKAGSSQKDSEVSTSQGSSHLHEGYENYCFSLEHDGEHQSCTPTRHQTTDDDSGERPKKRQDSSNIHHKHDHSQQSSSGHCGVALKVADLAVYSDRNCTHSILSENAVHVTAERPPEVGNVDIIPAKDLGHCLGQTMNSSTLETLDKPSNGGQNKNDGSFEGNLPAFTITHF